MDPVSLAQQATDILALALPFIYAGGKKVAEKVADKALDKVSDGVLNKAEKILSKLNLKKNPKLEESAKKVARDPKDPKALADLQQIIREILDENPELAREIQLTINYDIDFEIQNIGQFAMGNYNNFYNFESPSGEEYLKIIEGLEQKRKEASNQEILSRYNPSILPYYPEKWKKFVTQNRGDKLKKALIYIENHRILLLSGVGGVGKSTLARALVDLKPVNVPQPFWFSFQHNQDVNLETMLEKLAGYLQAPDILSFKGTRKAGIIDINRLTDELMNRDPVWLVFDDLSYITDTQRKFKDPDMGLLFLSLRDNTHQAKIILTSRVLPIMNNGERLIDELEDNNKEDLKGLETSFAIDYLKANGLEKVEYSTLKSLSESVDGHPFSLKLLIGLAKRHSLENILKNPEIYKKSKEERIKNARFLFDKLAGDEKEFLERISVFRKPEPLEAINMMLTENTPIYSVDTLLDKSLLETDHNGSYWLHPLVQEFSYEDLENKKEVHLIAYNYYKSQKLPENPTKKEDLRPAIEAHYHVCMAKEYDKAFAIIFSNKLDERLDLKGNYTLLIDLYSKLLPKDHFGNEILLKDKGDHGLILGNMGLAYYNMGDSRKAIEYYKQAIEIAIEIGDRLREGNAIKNLGNSYIHLGEPGQAIKCYKQATEIAKEIGDRCGECLGLGNLGFSYSRHGAPRKAIEYYIQAIEIAREIGDKRREGIWLGYLGNEYSNLGDSRKAIEYCEQAMEIARAEEDRRVEGIWIGYTGNAYRYLGETRKAKEYHEQELKIAEEILNRRGEENALGNLGLAYDYLGETKKAIEYCEQALNIARDIGDRCGEGNHLGNMGLAYSHLGETRKAIEYFEKALKISREIDDRRGEGNHLGNMGLAYRDLGKFRKAIEFLKQSLAIGKAIEDPRIVRLCEQNLKELEGSTG